LDAGGGYPTHEEYQESRRISWTELHRADNDQEVKKEIIHYQVIFRFLFQIRGTIKFFLDKKE
jgi:hypothetical protein